MKASSAIAQEDLELDRELERIAQETPPAFADDVPVRELKDLPEERELLSEVANVKPAATPIEIEQQIFAAQANGCDSIEITPELFRHYCGPDNGTNPNYSCGYVMYKGIKAYLVGRVDQAKKIDSVRMEEKVFGAKA